MIALQARRPHGFDTDALPLPVPVQRADWPVPGGTSAELLAARIDHDLGAFPLPRQIPAPKPRIGLLYWPGFGASRFAFGTFLIDSYTLGQIRSQLAGTNRVRLVYTDDPTDDAETERVFEMYLLGARPFVKPDDAVLPTDEPDTDDAYVITLVDQRYYWAGTSGSGHATAWRPASWTDLFNTLATRLGVTYSLADAVHADYGTPGGRWTGGAMSGHSAAGLLDAAAAAVGKRVVVDKGGAVKIQGPSVAAYDDVTAFHTTNADRHRWGGLIDYDDVRDGVPASVFVHVDENTETEVFLTDLAITDYDTAAGVADYKVTAWLDTTAAADRWATDFYNWQLVPLDATYAGIPDPVWSGYVGHYEIYHDADTAWTRLARPPFNYSGLRVATADGTGGNKDQPCPYGCGWLAGLSGLCCLKVTVDSVLGRCTCIDTTQVVTLTQPPATDYWISSATNKFEECDGASARLKFFVANGRPQLTFGDGGPDFVFDCCGRDVAYFTGGLGYCNPPPQDTCLVPSENIFRLKVEVVLCGTGSGSGSGPGSGFGSGSLGPPIPFGPCNGSGPYTVPRALHWLIVSTNAGCTPLVGPTFGTLRYREFSARAGFPNYPAVGWLSDEVMPWSGDLGNGFGSRPGVTCGTPRLWWTPCITGSAIWISDDGFNPPAEYPGACGVQESWVEPSPPDTLSPFSQTIDVSGAQWVGCTGFKILIYE